MTRLKTITPEAVESYITKFIWHILGAKVSNVVCYGALFYFVLWCLERFGVLGALGVGG